MGFYVNNFSTFAQSFPNLLTFSFIIYSLGVAGILLNFRNYLVITTVSAGLAYFSELTGFILSTVRVSLLYVPLFTLLFFAPFVHELVAGSIRIRNTSI
jgi:hypothetical protein